MGTDSASGDTSCDEAANCITPNDIPVANTSDSRSIKWVQGYQERKLTLTPVQEESELSSVQSESELVNVCDFTDSDTPRTAVPLCEKSKTSREEETREQTRCSKGKKLRNVCTFPGCSLSFSRPWRLEAHIRVHNGERPFKCTVDGCDKDYSNNAHLRRHMTRNHSTSKTRIKYKCPESDCFMLLSNKTALKRHIERKHTTQFHCSVCNLGFSKQSQLKLHMFQHKTNTDLPYKCDLCKSSFAMKRQCARHRLRKHRTYSCNHPDCAKVFPTWSLLLKHLKIDHPTPKYVCAICSRSFALKVNLRIHLQTHVHPAERKTYHCQLEGCSRYYYHIRNLTTHVKTSHEGKLFLCTYKDCNRQLLSKQKLEQHENHHKSVGVDRRRSALAKKRRDVGKAKRSMTSRMLGVVLPAGEEQRLIQDEEVLMLSDSSVSEAAVTALTGLVSDVESLA